MHEFLRLLAVWQPEAGKGAPEAESAVSMLKAAEALVDSGAAVPDSDWHRFLDLTRLPDFLESLPDAGHRERWAEVCFAAARSSGYTIETLLTNRTAAHPGHSLFVEPDKGEAGRWSYEQVLRRSRAYAAALLSAVPSGEPRVALLTPNRPRGAVCDLACLMHGIPIAPLNPEIPADVLAWICEKLEINVLISGGQGARQTVEMVRETSESPLLHILLDDDADPGPDALMIEEECARLSPDEVDGLLAERPRPGFDDPITTMFTSGSTGKPKGVVFTVGNLVTKRFARAAALPAVGRDEVMLCYLPLFHTFGRYLEMLGSIFWGGTYVFTGNPSKETLMALLPRIRPTGLISIPLRWQQIHDSCCAGDGGLNADLSPTAHCRSQVGDRLRWGLSAAGYLDPKVFRFFQGLDIDLCSGFGMTEATGGITMTRPGGYRDGSVGVPLPGVEVRLGELGELQVAGPYIATYLDPPPDADPRWLATGDLFREHDDGSLEIVDRIKDIYKNTRGQTIAPRRVEQKFQGVPGIRRVFLVGDHRNYNVLLIVPDPEDPMLQAAEKDGIANEYFRRIITAANRDLASRERVINFAVLDRDFSVQKGELTAKGTFRRKQIVENLAAEIEDLYRSNYVEVETAGLKVRIPRWFHRDLGILETEVVAHPGGVYDRHRDLLLPIEKVGDDRVRIGDLEYVVSGDSIDFGVISRQPLLWVGNPALVAFCPIKDGWDTALGALSPHLYLRWRQQGDGAMPAPVELPPMQDRRLERLHALSVQACLGDGKRSLQAVASLAQTLAIGDHRTADLIRRRLDALARHPEEEVRCAAYRVLLLDEPVPDYGQILPKFVESGLPFLNERSIEEISRGGLEKHRLQAFRRRLDSYRRHLPWPANDATRGQFENIFKLLTDFARFRPSYYGTVREELASWIVHLGDPEISQQAEQFVLELADWFESRLDDDTPHRDPAEWEGKILYQAGLSPAEVKRLEDTLVGTTFLQQSVMLAFDGEVLDMQDVPPRGVWISRQTARHPQNHYRIAVNTTAGKHFDLLAVLWDPDDATRDQKRILRTIYWMLALSGYPYGSPVMPRVGCYRSDIGALSLAYVNELDVGDRIREFASAGGTSPAKATAPTWRRLFVKGMATFFTAWRNSGHRLVPGEISPFNVAVPEPDFREGSRVLSLVGWRRYENPLSLVRPMLREFYLQTTANYPWTEALIDPGWICDAVVEALGRDDAGEFLAELAECLPDADLPVDGDILRERLAEKREHLRTSYYESCALRGAVQRYQSWQSVNADASPAAREQVVEEVMHLYGLNRQPEIERYHLYRWTIFDDAPVEVLEIFDSLLGAMLRQSGVPATNLVALSELQRSLRSDGLRAAFVRMVFPHSPTTQSPELLYVGEEEGRQVIVSSHIVDKQNRRFTVREPLDPSEHGRLYRLFFKAGYYRTISEQDRFFVISDDAERIIGGISWKEVDSDVVHLNGIVVTTSLLGRGISSALIEDFCVRMANLGYKAVKTLFVLRPFFERHGFRLDRRWGGLVRPLND